MEVVEKHWQSAENERNMCEKRLMLLKIEVV